MDITLDFTNYSLKVLRILSLIYGLVAYLRNLLYDTGILKSYKVPCIVISVGNIEAGGTGKTPFTLALAEELKSKGYNVAIVTRGYKGRQKGALLVNGAHDAMDVGDEALLMARVSSVPVIKAVDRVDGGLYATEKLGANMIILDDGFQHRRLSRDFDIVLVSRDLEKEHLVPWGRLREHTSQLKRSDMIVYTKGIGGEVQASLYPECLIARNGQMLGCELLQGKSVLAFCGIARPEGFFDMLKDLGADIETIVFKDHHFFSGRDIRRIKERAKDHDLVVTTEKDIVRLSPGVQGGNWYSLRVKMKVDGMDRIVQEIEKVAEKRHISG